MSLSYFRLDRLTQGLGLYRFHCNGGEIPEIEPQVLKVTQVVFVRFGRFPVEFYFLIR